MDKLIRYPKDTSGNRIGCFVAIESEDIIGAQTVVHIGWSSYNAEHEPRPFNKVLAREIATGRAEKGVTKGKMPDSLKKHMTAFLYKVNKVFNQPEAVIVVDQIIPRGSIAWES